MTHYPDLAPCDYYGPQNAGTFVAVGWLEPAFDYPRGRLPRGEHDKLASLLQRPYALKMTLGMYDCEMCGLPLSTADLFLPSGLRVFVAPGGVLHYVEVHDYLPPEEFRRAVLECPPMGSTAYFAAFLRTLWAPIARNELEVHLGITLEAFLEQARSEYMEDSNTKGSRMASILLSLRRFFGRDRDQIAATPVVDDDFRWLCPPEDLLDPKAWDQYWDDQLSHGLGPPITDMFCNERPLIKAMSQYAMKRILCAGNGVSMEPRALAAAGFDVVALDISPRALEIARTFPANDRLLERFFDVGSLRPGGHVDYVVGDILDPAASPGPFDVVIERRTAQNYQEPERDRVMAALAARLSPQSILFTHCHDARWRPRTEPRHVTGDWCRAQGWSVWNGVGPKPDGRVAWLFTSTG